MLTERWGKYSDYGADITGSSMSLRWLHRPRNDAVHFRTAISEERKTTARVHYLPTADLRREDLLFRSAGLKEDLAEWRDDHTLPRHPPFSLLPHMVTRREEHAIFQGARGQKVLPGVVDRRGIGSDDKFGALDRQAPARLRKEIIVANREAHGPFFQAENGKSGAAAKIDFLQTEQRGGMDFAVLAGDRAGGIDQYRGVVVKSRTLHLE